jgi:hypothetical protein
MGRFKTGTAIFLAGFLAMTSDALAQAEGPAPSRAATEEAGAHFRRGIELFKEADFRGALIELRRANQIAPSFRVLYNIGQCYLELQDYAGALRSFQAYLNEGGARIPRERRTAVEGDIQKLQGRVAYVEVTSNVAGAEVRVDEDVVGTTPLDKPVLVGSGRRKISVEKAGLPSAEKMIDVAGGDRLTLSLPLNQPTSAPAAASPPAAAPSPPPPAPPPAADTTPTAHAQSTTATPPPSSSSSHSSVWIGWTVTGVLAAGAVVTGVLALSAKQDSDTKLGTFPGNASDISNAHKNTQLFAALTDGLGGAAIIAGAFSLYFTLSSGKSEPNKSALAPAPKLRLGVATNRILLQGEF